MASTDADRVTKTATSTILLAVEAGAQAPAVIAAAARLARPADAEVVVLSVREREYSRGLVWDRRPPADTAEVVSHAIYELRRNGVRARGVVRLARSGRVAEEIVHAAHKHSADTIVIGCSRRSWLGALLMGSVGPRVLRVADVPVVTVPMRDPLSGPPHIAKRDSRVSGGPAQPAPPRTPRATRTPPLR